jgi:2-keto-3-deoxy-L-rhamnonate aldolase RhmA
MMRKSKTLARVRNNEVVRMCSLGHFIPSYVRHAAHFGYDCIWLDLEHREMTDHDARALMAYFHQSDIDCMLRPATLEKTRLYRYLEDGVTGFMIPHVSTAKKARMLVDAVKFPPIGDRGLDGAGFDSDFILGGPDYVEHANRETFLVVQIETPEAVSNADAIAAVNGVDALFIGPGDLGLRLKHADGSQTLEDCFKRVADAAAKHNKAWGCPVSSLEEMQRRREQGAQLLARGGDFLALMKMLEEWKEDFDNM